MILKKSLIKYWRKLINDRDSNSAANREFKQKTKL